MSGEYPCKRFVEEVGPAIRNYVRASSLYHFGDVYQMYYDMAENYMREYMQRNPLFGRVIKTAVRRLRSGTYYSCEDAETTHAETMHVDASFSPLPPPYADAGTLRSPSLPLVASALLASGSLRLCLSSHLWKHSWNHLR